MNVRLWLAMVSLSMSSFSAHAQSTTEPTAVLRSASFVTTDIDKTTAFYVELLGYKVLGDSEITADKSRRVVGATGDQPVRYIALAPAAWTKDDNQYAGISFIEIKDAEGSPFDQNPDRASRAGELILAHRVSNIDEIAVRVEAAGIPVVAPLGLSGSGKSRSMAILDPNGIRVEMYEY